MFRSIASLIIGTVLSGTIQAADLVVSSVGGPGVYTTIGAALSAANAGDRLLIQPDAYVETLTLTKAITLVPNVEAGTFTISGWVYVDPDVAATEVIICGATITGGLQTYSAPAGGLCRLSILGCSVTTVSADLANYHVTMASSTVGQVNLKLGRVLGCTTGNISISGDNTSSERTMVVGNVVNGSITLSTSNVFHVRNNLVKQGTNGISVSSTSLLTELSTIENNSLLRQGCGGGGGAYGIRCQLGGSNTSPVNIFNNYISSSSLYSTHLETSGPSVNVAYNAQDFGCNVNTNTGAPTYAPYLNAGHPGNGYLDLDLTRNDMGCYGGSWSRDNFDDAPAGAVLFMVDAPRQVVQGSTFTISAEGFDR